MVDVIKVSKQIDKIFKDLDLIAINLEIESAHIKESNGVRVISEHLRDIIQKGEKDIELIINEEEKDNNNAI